MLSKLSRINKSLGYRTRIALIRGYLNYRKVRNQVALNFFSTQANLTAGKAPDAFTDFRKEIDSLSVHINRDYCVLDLPDYNNLGDHLIYRGSQNFLNTLSFKNKHIASAGSFNSSKIDRNDLIILQGGGNFGDLWPYHQIFRERIISSFKNRKIIIFPQSIFFQKYKNLKHAVAVFSAHPDLTICVRDRQSYELAENNFTKNNILLLPDMASYISCGLNKKNTNASPRVLFMKRRDKELKKSIKLPFIKNLDTRDWPSVELSYYKYLTEKFKQSKSYMNEGILFLAHYDLVISTRLHGCILAVLLDIPTILLDNVYGKNKNYYNAWLKDISHCYFADDKQQLMQILENDFHQVIK